MTEIKREAGDKTKGFTLQKQRALALFFDEIMLNSNIHVNVAIEYKGDIYLQSGDSYVEEQKNYDESSTFSFNSKEILNTLVYFLNIWLTEHKSESIRFGFYSTNKIAKENKTTRTTNLNINLPQKPILELLQEKQYTVKDLFDTVKKYLIDEYQIQYKKDVSPELDNQSIEKFLNSINWNFEQNNEIEYEKIITQKIKDCEFSNNLLNPSDAEFVYAFLMNSLEKKQNEDNYLLKFLRKDSVENVFLKISKGEAIPVQAFKYLNFDFSEFNTKMKSYLETFLKLKYQANVKNKQLPNLLHRKVAKHNREVKIQRESLEQSDIKNVQHLEVVIKEFGELSDSDKPSFLFGEVGSGKSTLLAHYFLKQIPNDIISIFIPSSFLKGKIQTDILSFKDIINKFVNNELSLENKFFDLDKILLSKKELTLIIDGLDEFENKEVQTLINHLLYLDLNYNNLHIIASGRPIELQNIVNFNDWNCLSTLNLTAEEIKLLLKNEAIAAGMNEQEAENDSQNRYKILQSKNELLSNATTPLIVCLIRDFLDANISVKTLGDILYDVLKKHLNWHDQDNKVNYDNFLNEYPNILQRERFLAEIAYKIHLSPNNKINEDVLFNVVNSNLLVSDSVNNRNSVVNEAILFFKHNFLQKVGEEYVFQSHQLFQVVLGLQIFYIISSKEKFDFKNEQIEKWREISYAGAIARIKGESLKISNFFSGFLDSILLTSDSTAVSAVVLLETQMTILNKIFLEKVKRISFRPLKYWGKNDSLVPHAYAYILKNLGEDGFNWFFENYLNPRHPNFVIGDDLVEFILQYYLVLNEFNLTDNEKKRLTSIIDYHIAARTFSCIDLLPLLALVLPENFKEEYRCKLLVSAAKSDMMFSRAEKLLKIEWEKGLEQEIIDALEIICDKKNSDGYININILKLWFKFTDKDIPKSILDNCIISIAKRNEEIFNLIIKKVDKKKLESYLRFNTLYKSQICDSASILLYRYYGERDIHLIGEPLLIKSQWFDYKNEERRKIIQDLIFSDGANELEFVIKKHPNSDKNQGLPEDYIFHFLQAAIILENTYIDEFLNVVNEFDKYVLSRHPEIRSNLIKLLARHDYYEALRKCLTNLNQDLRYNAAMILLTCFPESEKEALEIIVRSCCLRLSEYAEFFRFCMKLNYSKEMLDFLFGLLGDLTEIPRVFALKLLYHNNEYKLNDELLHELISGVLSKGSFLDYSPSLNDDGIESIQRQDKFLKHLKSLLYDANYEIRQSVSLTLLSYFRSSLSIEEKATCWLFKVQYSSMYLNVFSEDLHQLLENQEFASELKKSADYFFNDYKKQSVLSKYYEAYYEDGDWKIFFLTFLQSGIIMDHHDLERLYLLLVQINDTSVRRKIGIAAKELMAAPTFSQEKEYGFIFPMLALYAHEFGELNEDEITNILTTYTISQDEIVCSLLYRLGKIPKNAILDTRLKESYYPLFMKNSSKEFTNLKTIKIEDQLIEGRNIPENLTEVIESVLIDDYYTDDELCALCKTGKLATYFFIVISFCRGKNILELNKLLTSDEVGSMMYYPRYMIRLHKSILLKIKDIILLEKNNKETYISALIEDIDSGKNRETVDLFNDLFELEADFEIQLLPRLFDSLLDYPSMLNLDLTYKIFDFVLKSESKSDLGILLEPLKRQLKMILSIGKERRSENFELVIWCLTLILLYIEKKSDEYTKRGFLIGLNNIFIQDGYNYASSLSKSEIRFKGRDLLANSYNIFNLIENYIIKEIIQEGVKSNIPEVSSLCKVLSTLSH